ncbi:MAG: hypothetical protein ABIG66_00450 [Candidatus Kerfeldbacteria bacterium]
MRKKIFGMLYSDADWHKAVPFENREMRESYERLYQRASDHYGMEAYRMSMHWYKDGYFDRAWAWNGSKWVKVRKRIKADVYYDKISMRYDRIGFKQEFEKKNLMINPMELDLLASDKLLSSVMFYDIMPDTYRVSSRAELLEGLAKIKTRKAVLKPRMGYGGAGIIIESKAKMKHRRPNAPCILQPHIDTSAGIPGLFNDTHDLRVNVAGDKPVMTYIRTVAPGTELCNISQGGGICFLPVSKIPQSVKPLLKRVSDALAIFPYKFYGADFFFQNGKPYMVELNTKPNMVYFTNNLKEEQRMHDVVLTYVHSIMHS